MGDSSWAALGITREAILSSEGGWSASIIELVTLGPIEVGTEPKTSLAVLMSSAEASGVGRVLMCISRLLLESRVLVCISMSEELLCGIL